MGGISAPVPAIAFCDVVMEEQIIMNMRRNLSQGQHLEKNDFHS
jgi:hypothetical protein